MKTARLTADARQDVQALLDYYKNRREPDAARRIMANLRKTYRFLSDHPFLGDPRDDLAIDLRCGFAGTWLVFYRPVPSGIQILRILSSSREVRPETFGDEEEHSR